jgi:type II secretion system protein G
MRTTNRKGFTLIELLIVVVIIGILAAVAIPKFSNTKEKAYAATMKTDLKNLATVEESYFNDNSKYGTHTELAAKPYEFKMSDAATQTSLVVTASASGWNATAKDVRISADSKQNCGIKGGDGATAAAPLDAAAEGVVVCWK